MRQMPRDAARTAVTEQRWWLDGNEPEYLAREAVTGILTVAGMGRDCREDTELAVAELVANARRHAPGPRELRVRVSGQAVTFAVADGGSDHAVVACRLAAAMPGVACDAECGRGLQIVAALFPGACGVTAAPAGPGAPGKEVWVTVRLPRPPATEDFTGCVTVC
jgi:anti-sigma regulatory factor (Ser/Thr protein kinase)